MTSKLEIKKKFLNKKNFWKNRLHCIDIIIYHCGYKYINHTGNQSIPKNFTSNCVSGFYFKIDINRLYLFFCLKRVSA